MVNIERKHIYNKCHVWQYQIFIQSAVRACFGGKYMAQKRWKSGKKPLEISSSRIYVCFSVSALHSLHTKGSFIKKKKKYLNIPMHCIDSFLIAEKRGVGSDICRWCNLSSSHLLILNWVKRIQFCFSFCGLSAPGKLLSSLKVAVAIWLVEFCTTVAKSFEESCNWHYMDTVDKIWNVLVFE